METDSRIRVLVVDDHAGVRDSLTSLLGHQPDMHVAAEATTGEEAIVAYRRYRPDVLLMDTRMPGMDGLAATKVITGEFPEASILVFCLSEFSYPQALAAGAKACFVKGNRMKDLLAIVRQLYQNRTSD